MDTAELVQLMVNLVEDESFVIVGGVVLHYVVYYKRRRETGVNSWDGGVPRVGLSTCSENLMAQSQQQELQCQSEVRNAPTREACTTNRSFVQGSFIYC